MRIAAALALGFWMSGASAIQPLTSFATLAQAGQRETCSDEHSAKVLGFWLEAFPAESRAAIEDPAVRSTTRRAALNPSTEELKNAARRIYLHEAAANGRVDPSILERRLAELRRANPAVNFPKGIRDALVNGGDHAKSYLNAAVNSLRSQPRQLCARVFQNYLARIDDRMALLSTYEAKFGADNKALQQNHSGEEDEEVFRAPTSECELRPRVPDFFKIKPNGHFEGRYSALGFPDAVKLALSTADGAQKWACSGVLISEKWVLTAGHCVDDGVRVASPEMSSVLVNGSVAEKRRAAGQTPLSALKSPTLLPDEYRAAIAKPGSSASDRAPADLALMELALPLSVTSRPSPAGRSTPASVLATLAGYGATLGTPAQGSSRPFLDVGWMHVSVDERMIRWDASNLQPGPGTNASCPGDSGAPIYVVFDRKTPPESRPGVGCRDERRQLVGLVSFGQSVNSESCLVSSKGGGPRLFHHHDWICQKTGVFCN